MCLGSLLCGVLVWENQEMHRWTGCRDITKKLLKTELNPNQSDSRRAASTNWVMIIINIQLWSQCFQKASAAIASKCICSWIRVNPFLHITNLQQMILKTSRLNYGTSIFGKFNYWKKFKTLWQMEKLLIMSNFSFCYNVFKSGKGLIYLSLGKDSKVCCFSMCSLSISVIQLSQWITIFLTFIQSNLC